jgi:hypothetical protein
VRSLAVTRQLCHHEAVMRVDAFDDRISVPVFGLRMVCTSCGIVGADVRSNWKERTQRESLTGRQRR